MRYMTPETEEQLKMWNATRLEILNTQKGIETLEVRVSYLRDKMDEVTRRLENALFNLESPIGMKIGDDYVIVIQDPNDNFVIQTVDFNLRQEIKNS